MVSHTDCVCVCVCARVCVWLNSLLVGDYNHIWASVGHVPSITKPEDGEHLFPLTLKINDFISCSDWCEETQLSVNIIEVSFSQWLDQNGAVKESVFVNRSSKSSTTFGHLRPLRHFDISKLFCKLLWTLNVFIYFHFISFYYIKHVSFSWFLP